MKKVYAFYTSIPLSNQTEEFACANWWKTSWEKAGWTTFMLNRSHAQGSSLNGKLQQKLAHTLLKLGPELTNRYAWINARFSRWCALHAAGGGWMSDYDCLNLGFKPEHADDIEQRGTLHVSKGPAYLFYATADHCANAIKRFISEDLIDGDSVRDETDILNIKPINPFELEFAIHVKTRGSKTRPERMEAMWAKKEAK